MGPMTHGGPRAWLGKAMIAGFRVDFTVSRTSGRFPFLFQHLGHRGPHTRLREMSRVPDLARAWTRRRRCRSSARHLPRQRAGARQTGRTDALLPRSPQAPQGRVEGQFLDVDLLDGPPRSLGGCRRRMLPIPVWPNVDPVRRRLPGYHQGMLPDILQDGREENGGRRGHPRQLPGHSTVSIGGMFPLLLLDVHLFVLFFHIPQAGIHHAPEPRPPPHPIQIPSPPRKMLAVGGGRSLLGVPSSQKLLQLLVRAIDGVFRQPRFQHLGHGRSQRRDGRGPGHRQDAKQQMIQEPVDQRQGGRRDGDGVQLLLFAVGVKPIIDLAAIVTRHDLRCRGRRNVGGIGRHGRRRCHWRSGRHGRAIARHALAPAHLPREEVEPLRSMILLHSGERGGDHRLGSPSKYLLPPPSPHLGSPQEWLRRAADTHVWSKLAGVSVAAPVPTNRRPVIRTNRLAFHPLRYRIHCRSLEIFAIRRFPPADGADCTIWWGSHSIWRSRGKERCRRKDQRTSHLVACLLFYRWANNIAAQAVGTNVREYAQARRSPRRWGWVGRRGGTGAGRRIEMWGGEGEGGRRRRRRREKQRGRGRGEGGEKGEGEMRGSTEQLQLRALSTELRALSLGILEPRLRRKAESGKRKGEDAVNWPCPCVELARGQPYYFWVDVVDVVVVVDVMDVVDAFAGAMGDDGLTSSSFKAPWKAEGNTSNRPSKNFHQKSNGFVHWSNGPHPGARTDQTLWTHE